MDNATKISKKWTDTKQMSNMTFLFVKISEGNNVVFWTATISNNIDFTIEALITLVVILKYKKQCL